MFSSLVKERAEILFFIAVLLAFLITGATNARAQAIEPNPSSTADPSFGAPNDDPSMGSVGAPSEDPSFGSVQPRNSNTERSPGQQSIQGPNQQSVQSPNQQSTQGPNQQAVQGSNGVVGNPLSFKTLQAFFDALLKFLAMLALPFVVFMLILTGFYFVTAQGDSEKLKTARKMLLYTIIGGLLILGASVIATVVRGTVDSLGLLDQVLQAAAPLFNF